MGIPASSLVLFDVGLTCSHVTNTQRLELPVFIPDITDTDMKLGINTDSSDCRHMAVSLNPLLLVAPIRWYRSKVCYM